jgi:hypothetical protein
MGGATSFRKAAVSAVHESTEDMRGDLADLVVHHKTTADKFYLLRGSLQLKHQRNCHTLCVMPQRRQQPDEQPAEKEADASNVIICHRHKWSSEEKDLLKQLFATQIKTKSIQGRS